MRGIRNLNRRHGVAQRYNETLTRAWVRAVGQHVAESAPTGDFETFMPRFPALTRGDLMLRHYRAENLWSDEARERWVEPDIAPFPV